MDNSSITVRSWESEDFKMYINLNMLPLMRKVKQAKAAYEKAVKMQKYFTKERNF